MTNPLKRTAICYDFDGTLIRGNMQENSFIPELGMEKQEFWDEVRVHAIKHDMDMVLAYMDLMIQKAKEKKVRFTKDRIRSHGASVVLFPGVLEWFDVVDAFGREQGLEIEHYIISSGIAEMIYGSPIGDKFKYVFASDFAYDENDVPYFAARSINYTTKTQYLFRINKGMHNSWDSSVNEYMPHEERPIPFARMIYIGDGETDVPSMKMLNYQGGYSVCVYPPSVDGQPHNEPDAKKKKTAEDIKARNRAQFIAAADYAKGSDLYNIITSLLVRIADEERHEMNRKA